MKKILKIVLWLIVIAVFAGTFVFLFNNSKPKEVTYELVTPAVGTIERTAVLTGKIEPRDEIEIKPQISGIITEINVEAGDFVKAGDVIAKIKVIPDDSQLNSANNRVDVARLALDQARNEYERTEHLYERKFVSREEYEQAQNTMLKAQSELESALDALQIVRSGVSKYNSQESNTLVRATIDGQVLEVPVKVGSSVIQANTMNDGTTVAKIADMNNLIFIGKADETEVGLLRQGMPTAISIGALPDFSPTAEIEYIAPKSTESGGSNTFEIKAAIKVPKEGRLPACDNDNGTTDIKLRAGYSANATVTLQRVTDVTTVPESVVEWSGDSTFVYVLTQEEPQQFARTAITTGISDGVNVQVIDGIGPKQRLRGQQRN